MAIIKSVIDRRYNANSYIFLENSSSCIIVDSNINTYNYIMANNLVPELLFLTHEHFDHVTGITNLKHMFPQMMIVSSKEASKLVQDPRDNMSLYHDGVGVVEIGSDIFTDDISSFKCLGHNINTFFAPGHTSAGILIQIDNILFTGDTLLDIKTPVNMPNSSKKQLVETLDFIDRFFDNETIFYQGHGNPFSKINWNKDISLGIKK